jgi:glyoxylase-like metal-dependent hydrolase (beta-lactamase superfamily II)
MRKYNTNEMKIINLTENSKLYTSNVFLMTGTWNSIDDINTLVDVGNDDSIISKIENINTGLGKKKIDQVILTHSHSDHAALLQAIKDVFNPCVRAFNTHLKGVDQILRDGDILKIGDKQFEVFHITAHSHDSICLFCEEESVLFAGDTTFPIEYNGLDNENSSVLTRLLKKNIKTVYYGHGPSHDFEDKKFKVIKD